MHRTGGIGRVVAVVIAAGLLLPGPASAQAYQPTYDDGGGGDAAASIYCSPGLIQLGPPTIWAIPPGDAISSRTQEVGWAVTIWYSSDLVTWTKTNAVPYWYFGWVNDRWYALTFNGYWYSTDPIYKANPAGFGNEPYWTVNYKGYYAATMQIVWWFGDGTVASIDPQITAYTLGAGGLWSDRAPYCTQY